MLLVWKRVFSMSRQGLHGHVMCVNLQCWYECNTAYLFSQSTEEELSVSKCLQTVIIKIDPRDQVFCCSTASAVALEGKCCIFSICIKYSFVHVVLIISGYCKSVWCGITGASAGTENKKAISLHWYVCLSILSILQFWRECLAYAYSQTHSLLKYILFDCMHKYRCSTCPH